MGKNAQAQVAIVPLQGDVKTIRTVNASSVTRATVATPASGKRIRVHAVNVSFEAATSNGLEIYFHTGTNIGTNAGKEVTEVRQAAVGPVFEAWPAGHGPIGQIDEVLAIRGTANVAENVVSIITYTEE